MPEVFSLASGEGRRVVLVGERKKNTIRSFLRRGIMCTYMNQKQSEVPFRTLANMLLKAFNFLILFQSDFEIFEPFIFFPVTRFLVTSFLFSDFIHFDLLQ